MNLFVRKRLHESALTGTNGSSKNIKLVGSTPCGRPLFVWSRWQARGPATTLARGPTTTPAQGPATTPKRRSGKYNHSVEKRSKQAAIVSSKSEKPKPLPPAYDDPWKKYQIGRVNPLWLTAFRLVQMAGTGACHYAETEVWQIQPFCGEKIQTSCDYLFQIRESKTVATCL